MMFAGLSALLEAGLLLTAMAFGAVCALIVVELRKKTAAKSASNRITTDTPAVSEEERIRRQDLLVQLMGLYSGVHSADALSSFLNRELERRYETWRVRVPLDGPGEIYDPGPI
jgi:hypothetical protein